MAKEYKSWEETLVGGGEKPIGWEDFDKLPEIEAIRSAGGDKIIDFLKLHISRIEASSYQKGRSDAVDDILNELADLGKLDSLHEIRAVGQIAIKARNQTKP